ncbi:bifunctional phosphopantothenoylcysteine decarboxylase/phosphopantothenate--cysteine ligase CoaBC [Propionimicrobium sp. PCR01-08-3]|uniref:bifunctional phosphopantothenoylcysteine decarboxylase/phosphopantothenate--cysteine ligase CoaBC n=1 Tax=Propionimicrobium sp. PCR01-08-3 TaxID=3052086 RepID=UPI00255C79EF|nr:bifunctional phosphopantothenoylcysteine decarboxylase/phosphopantothenate--cysteine ligase CoaBC [Propionimicrobium sp. PCR01-08-3]WIY81430.1 bifunctional phosphopantothenoylcysteine decarboxylase/phosphopantothenate--cysteine ligase CoaBC [Propionimicrobium sp. PCR01-08-3]
MNIVLGVSGGIAAYKAVMVARLLAEEGHDVHIVPTEDALHFVGKPTWEAISRHPVTTSVHENVAEVRHVALGQQADLVIVAPATANTLAKMATGIADNLLGTTLLATQAPVLVAPAMHTQMWLHPATQANMATLRSRGVQVIGPDKGRLTGADSGPGRMSEPAEIVQRAIELLAAREAHGDLAGVRIVVSAGGTREPIDPVRYIGNRSSGRQGGALAQAAAARGATVTVLAANVEDAVLAEIADLPAVDIEQVGTAADLQEAVQRHADSADVIVMAAAVADYRVESVHDTKLRKEEASGPVLSLELVENPDILRGLVAARRPGQIIVGFAAETASDEDALLELGRSKLARKGVDLLAVNAVGWTQGFESTENTLYVLAAGGELVATASGTKREAADGLLDAIAGLPGRQKL